MNRNWDEFTIKQLKKVFHSELEKARAQAILSAEKETVKRCIEAIEKNRKFWESVGYGQHLGGINVGFEKSIRALSLPDQEQLSNTKTDE